MAKNDGRSTTCRVTNRKVALLACGSFNPPTFAHLRMFERAKDYLERIVGYSVVEGVISPIADTMECVDLLSAKHRIKMAKLAVQDSSWIRVDDWESEQGDTVQTVQVLQHLREVLAHKYDMDKEDVQPMLLCGGDVVESIAQMDKSEVDFSDTDSMANILRDFGLVVVARANTDPMKAIYSMDLLRQNQRNIHVIEDETFPNNLSASRLRTAVRRRESIHYCTDEKVVAYIESNNLYTAVPASSSPPPRDLITRKISPKKPLTSDSDARPKEWPARVPLPPRRHSSIFAGKLRRQSDIYNVASSASDSSNEPPPGITESPAYGSVTYSDPLVVSNEWAKYLQAERKEKEAESQTMVVEQVDEEIFVVADREEASNSARNTFAPSFPGPLLHPVRSSSEERIKPMICESCERSSRISSDDWQGKTDKATTTERTNRFFPNVTGRPKSDSNVSELTGDVAHLSVRATDVLKPSVDNIRLTYRRYKLGDTPETTV